MIGRLIFASLIAALATAGCARHAPDNGPIDVSAIGPLSERADPDRGPLSAGDALLIDATAEGLVTADAAGQIEPALADRWIVTTDGLGYIFHLRDARWPDGKPVTAETIVRQLRRALRSSSRNVVQPALAAISEISAVLPQVVDIRLDRPLPGFLAVLAQPELAVRRGDGEGTGRYRIARRQANSVLLAPRTPHALPKATLRGDRAAVAILRFKRELTDLVAGGTIGSLLLVREADLVGPPLRFDPVRGLYGLTLGGDAGALSDPVLRRALLMGIDGDAMIATAGLPGLSAAHGLVPADTGDYAAPGTPDWLAPPIAQRRAVAAATIRAWIADHSKPLAVSISRPVAVGDQLMVALLARQWRALGVTVAILPPDQPANLRLIDEIAPIDAPEWYLGHFTCKATIACSPVADAAIAEAAHGNLHAALTGEAARLMVEEAPFFALANPVRWSLVAPGLDGYRDNPLALHPIARLRGMPGR